MNKSIVLIAVLSLCHGQDEFFQPTKSIGGYGELHYSSSAREGSDTIKELDFHRFIIYYAASFSEKWSFFSEVELEHNFVNDGEGELELEQAYKDRNTAIRRYNALHQLGEMAEGMGIDLTKKLPENEKAKWDFKVEAKVLESGKTDYSASAKKKRKKH